MTGPKDQAGRNPGDSMLATLRRSRPLLLLAALVAHIMLGPQLENSWLRLALQVAVIMASASLAADTPVHRRFTLLLAVSSALLLGLGGALEQRGVEWLGLTFLLGLYVHVIRLLLRRIFYARRVTLDEIGLALCTYILLGVLWVLFYVPLVILQPDAFVFNVPVDAERVGDAMTYFSYVTLTTLGYGDIVPVSPLARSLAIVEALTGVLFLAVLISRLVGAYGKRSE